MSFDKINTPTVRENFVRQIENKILSGELRPGDKLPPAKELCRLMGVSLTVVNAGMSELAGKGFVETVPRRGTYVADYRSKGNAGTLSAIMRFNGGRLSDDDIRSLCETRLALDRMVVSLVVARAGDEEIASLEPLLEEMEGEKDLDRCCGLIVKFYHRLAEISGNLFMSLLYNSTAQPQKVIYLLFCQKNGTASVVQNARQLYEALLQRDGEKAQLKVYQAVSSALSGDLAIVPAPGTR